MRKHRTWLMGFGIGIIVGTCMLQLILYAEKQNQNLMVADGILTQTQLEQSAKQMGFKLQPAKEKSYTQQQLDQEIGKAVASARDQAAAKQPADQSGKTPSPDPSKSGESTVAFYVNTKMDLTTMARSLKILGVISDAEGFVDEARSISRQIQPGVSSFHGKPSYKEIMAELTREKNN